MYASGLDEPNNHHTQAYALSDPHSALAALSQLAEIHLQLRTSTSLDTDDCDMDFMADGRVIITAARLMVMALHWVVRNGALVAVGTVLHAALLRHGIFPPQRADTTINRRLEEYPCCNIREKVRWTRSPGAHQGISLFAASRGTRGTGVPCIHKYRKERNASSVDSYMNNYAESSVRNHASNVSTTFQFRDCSRCVEATMELIEQVKDARSVCIELCYRRIPINFLLSQQYNQSSCFASTQGVARICYICAKSVWVVAFNGESCPK